MGKTKASDAEQSSQINFETSLEQLEQLVQQIENGDLTLQQSLEVFEQGIKLTKQCQKALEQAEQKVKILTADESLEEFTHE